MKNRDQLRAEHAMKACQDNARFQTKNKADVTKSVATMVLDCGILPSLAFAMENGEKAYKNVFEAFGNYLSGNNSTEELMKNLVNKDSAYLRYVTAECIAYLKYLRRFANIKEP